MNIKDIHKLEQATKKGRTELFRLGLGLIFMVGVMLYASAKGVVGNEGTLVIVIAAAIGAYMAMNIGANDVANNVGPAVGSKALTLFGALVIAAIFEAAGALIAGGEVVGTIRNGIINPNLITDSQTFVWIMMAALLAAALWLNVATAIGAPVSTTHSIVGAIIGSGIAASGMDIVNWGKMTEIAASWVVSPVLGGLVAAAMLYFIKRTIIYQSDMVGAARKIVPWLIAFMGWTFGTYLILKGLNRVWKVSFLDASLIGVGIAVLLFLFTRWRLSQFSPQQDAKQSVNQLFTIPLIFAAALLSFAHGSNDVANAVGPLAAIVDVYSSVDHIVHKEAAIPMWVMVVGALGISLGLALYGPKVIRTIGSEITDLDQTRAYCIAMSATITVIIASQMGMPVSSTHIAVGGVFGVGFLREYLKYNYDKMIAQIKAHHPEGDQVAIDAFLAKFNKASIDEKGVLLRELKAQAKRQMDPAHFSKAERNALKKVYRTQLVQRSQLLRIAAAWVITVPATALMAGLIFFIIKGVTAS
ncbi:inorganic phosphate transporter [uncultured Agitococcus sp.]|uniref:inorganic phosphate transporter n=1 Tax=uncultured Agitococcus sp. TaxID=1506599 RepID=UPI002621DC43|nr:inorganic phosphate transporter [uncultured Agitococcus sp.]